MWAPRVRGWYAEGVSQLVILLLCDVMEEFVVAFADTSIVPLDWDLVRESHLPIRRHDPRELEGFPRIVKAGAVRVAARTA